jgi:Rod binding domain-containing protein
MDLLGVLRGLTSGDAEKVQDSRQLVRAAQDFEAVLLGSLLRSLEETFSAAPGDAKPAGDDDYHYLGTQALAGGLAASGGFGIATMIIRNLLKNKGAEGQGSSSAQAKVSPNDSR